MGATFCAWGLIRRRAQRASRQPWHPPPTSASPPWSRTLPPAPRARPPLHRFLWLFTLLTTTTASTLPISPIPSDHSRHPDPTPLGLPPTTLPQTTPLRHALAHTNIPTAHPNSLQTLKTTALSGFSPSENRNGSPVAS